MKPINLKYLIIQQKKNLKYLCFNHEQVKKVEELVKEIKDCEILFLNTNLGLEVYYVSNANLKELIVSALNVVAAKQKNKLEQCQIQHFSAPDEIKNRFLDNIILLNTIPVAYKCYIQSSFRQYENYNEKNSKIIHVLINLWHNSLVTIDMVPNNRKLFISYLKNFIAKNDKISDKINLVKHLAELTISLSSKS